jgi:hypothetical protein
MFKQLTIAEAPAYLEHVRAVYKDKGLMSVKDKEWVGEREIEFGSEDEIRFSLTDPQTQIFGEIEPSGSIIRTMRTYTWEWLPYFTLHNFKSSAPSTFPLKVVKSLFPLWDFVMTQQANKGLFTAYLLRPLRWMNPAYHEVFSEYAPMDRYDSYFERVIPANTQPSHNRHRAMMSVKTYPIDMVIVSLHLKQHLRGYPPGIQKAFL